MGRYTFCVLTHEGRTLSWVPWTRKQAMDLSTAKLAGDLGSLLQQPPFPLAAHCQATAASSKDNERVANTQILLFNMRYDDWDVLLFPSSRVERVPFKEFSVNCHVVEDAESPHGRTSFGLPAMTCFVPSLQPGAQFHISIHSWGTPRISQYALAYSKFPLLVKLEARIMIDGRMVA